MKVGCVGAELTWQSKSWRFLPFWRDRDTLFKHYCYEISLSSFQLTFYLNIFLFMHYEIYWKTTIILENVGISVQIKFVKSDLSLSRCVQTRTPANPRPLTCPVRSGLISVSWTSWSSSIIGPLYCQSTGKETPSRQADGLKKTHKQIQS